MTAREAATAARHPGPLRVTMAEVAREAGVSGATVSRVLQGSAAVLPETRAAVMAAVDRTGYVPNSAAQQLARRRSDAVGLLLRDPVNPTYGLLHSQLQLRTAESGRQLLTVSPSQDQGARQESSGLRRLLQLRVGGILVATGVITTDELVPFVAAVPTVVLGRPERHPLVTAVSYDEESNARLITEEVVGHGHRAVAVVEPPREASLAENFRARAMVAGLRATGCRVVVVPAPTFGRADETTPELVRLARDRAVSAVMFPADRRLVEFIAGAQHAGLAVPRDVSATGIDGVMPGLEVMGLSTVRVPVETVARRGVEVLGELGEHAHVRHEAYPGTLVPGRTLARAH